jgi:NAD(P)-dependent dehydrogenase (short-subunit alcohol dehydrogenase family)
MIQRIPVLGGGVDLARLVSRYGISQVLIAAPSGTTDDMTRIVQYCRDAQVSCKTVPAIAELISHTQLTSQIREIAMEDLLGRHPVRLAEQDILGRIGGHTVIVTGAAGSIGSELCRQLPRFGPKAIIGFDIAETALFHVQQELRQSFPALSFIADIGSIQNPGRLQQVLDRHQPSVLYHTAAHKHVPMTEESIFEAMESNMLGTFHVAKAAADAGVRDFVMISSDKAVNPTNIMGATKTVQVQIQYPNSGDLNVYLYSPQLTRTILLQHDCAVQNVDTTFDDAAPTFWKNNALAIVNAASTAGEGTVAPGEMLSIFGIALGPTTAVSAPSGALPTTLGGTSVTINGTPDPIAFSSYFELQIQAPFNLGTDPLTPLQVTFNNQSTSPILLTVVGSAPGLYTRNMTGTGQVNAANQDGSLNSKQQPASKGSVMVSTQAVSAR